jgi:hypothetical protein
VDSPGSNLLQVCDGIIPSQSSSIQPGSGITEQLLSLVRLLRNKSIVVLESGLGLVNSTVSFDPVGFYSLSRKVTSPQICCSFIPASYPEWQWKNN